MKVELELEQAERMGQTLQESEQILRSLFEFAPDAFAIHGEHQATYVENS
jgi:hypothetical protein